MYAAPTDYGSTGAIYFQGFGTVLPPLEPGVHEMKLYDLFDLSDLDPFNYALVFDNTWTITVEPPQPVFQVVAYRRGAQRWRWNPFPFFQGWLQARFENTGEGGAHNVKAPSA